jgi:hypothetical protein
MERQYWGSREGDGHAQTVVVHHAVQTSPFQQGPAIFPLCLSHLAGNVKKSVVIRNRASPCDTVRVYRPPRVSNCDQTDHAGAVTLHMRLRASSRPRGCSVPTQGPTLASVKPLAARQISLPTPYAASRVRDRSFLASRTSPDHEPGTNCRQSATRCIRSHHPSP